jgi:uncharacterized protein (TIGR02588 family)
MSADDVQQEEGRSGRSPAEWVTFAASCIVLAVLVVLVASGMRGEAAPAQPTARVDGAVERRSDGFHVPVLVRNVGDDAAADVQVIGELTLAGEPIEGEEVIAFLAGQEDAEVVLVFPEDPADGELVVRVASFSQP